MNHVFPHSAATVLAVRHAPSSWYHLHFSALPIVALLAGILILVRPQLLNYVVAGYLILVGVFGLFHIPW